jgi:hypothetical protein
MVSFEEILRGKVFDPPTEAWSFSILFLSFALPQEIELGSLTVGCLSFKGRFSVTSVARSLEQKARSSSCVEDVLNYLELSSTHKIG